MLSHGVAKVAMSSGAMEKMEKMQFFCDFVGKNTKYGGKAGGKGSRSR